MWSIELVKGVISFNVLYSYGRGFRKENIDHHSKYFPRKLCNSEPILFFVPTLLSTKGSSKVTLTVVFILALHLTAVRYDAYIV